MTEAEIRIQMVAACKTLEADGLNRGASGNLSVRFGEHMLITPTAASYYRALAIGGGQSLSDAQIEETSQGFENYGIRTKEAI